MNPFLLLVVALAVTGTLGIFLGEIFVLIIAVALAVFYAALFLFAPTTIDAIPDATKNVLIIVNDGRSGPVAHPGPKAEDLRAHTFPWLVTLRRPRPFCALGQLVIELARPR
jgi:hypothetical protein